MAKPFNYDEFARRLDETHEWPCKFTFKFIMQPQHLGQFKNIFPDDRWTTRESRQGKYISVTMERQVISSSDVKAVYTQARQIPGVILL